MLHFGDDLVRLAVDIDAGHTDRRAGAKARTRTTSGLLAALAKERLAMATKTTKDAMAMRKHLAAAVSKDLAAMHRDRLKSGTAMHRELKAGRGKLTADVNAFRAGLVGDAVVAAEELHMGLADFVTQLRADTAELLDAVTEETRTARTAWPREPAAKATPPRRKKSAKTRSHAAG